MCEMYLCYEVWNHESEFVDPEKFDKSEKFLNSNDHKLIPSQTCIWIHNSRCNWKHYIGLYYIMDSTGSLHLTCPFCTVQVTHYTAKLTLAEVS